MRAARNIIEDQQPLLFVENRASRHRSRTSLLDELAAFRQFRTRTEVTSLGEGEDAVPVFVNEFWTSKQRAASSLHEISYRACFKPQLPRFFVERLTEPGDAVYDPFMGRGTTLVEAALLGRVPVGCDINPLSVVLTRPRLHPPEVDEVVRRLRAVDYSNAGDLPEDLLAFYHRDTLREICALRNYLIGRGASGKSDFVDDWIRMWITRGITGCGAGSSVLS